MKTRALIGVMPDLANSNGTTSQYMINFLQEPPEPYSKSHRCIRKAKERQVTVWRCVKEALKAEPEEKKAAQQRVLSGKRTSTGMTGRSEDIVARNFGFVSANSYRFAKQVYLYGDESLKRLVDSGLLKMTPASRLAGLPSDIQQKAVSAIDAAHKRGFSSRLSGRIVALACESDARRLDELHLMIVNGADLATLKSMLASSEKSISKDQPDSLDTAVNSIRSGLEDILFRITSEKHHDNADSTMLYGQLSRIEKLAANMKEHLSFKAGDESICKCMAERHKQLRGTVQFFSHYLLRKKISLPSSLRDELSCSFHNAVVILSCMAENLTLYRGVQKPRPADHPGMIYPRHHSGAPDGASLKKVQSHNRWNKKRR